MCADFCHVTIFCVHCSPISFLRLIHLDSIAVERSDTFYEYAWSMGELNNNRSRMVNDHLWTIFDIAIATTKTKREINKWVEQAAMLNSVRLIQCKSNNWIELISRMGKKRMIVRESACITITIGSQVATAGSLRGPHINWKRLSRAWTIFMLYTRIYCLHENRGWKWSDQKEALMLARTSSAADAVEPLLRCQ